MIEVGDRSAGARPGWLSSALAPPCGEHERLEEQLDGRDIVVGDRQRHDRGIELALPYALHQRRGDVLVEGEVDLGVALEQLAQHQRDQVGPDGRDRAERQAAAERLLSQAAQIDQLVTDLQQRARPLDHPLAQRGHHDAAVGALEDLDAQQLLDLAHLHAQRRLADVAARRGAPEVALFGHRHDVLEVAQIEARQRHPGCIAAFRALGQGRWHAACSRRRVRPSSRHGASHDRRNLAAGRPLRAAGWKRSAIWRAALPPASRHRCRPRWRCSPASRARAGSGSAGPRCARRAPRPPRARRA